MKKISLLVTFICLSGFVLAGCNLRSQTTTQKSVDTAMAEEKMTKPNNEMIEDKAMIKDDKMVADDMPKDSKYIVYSSDSLKENTDKKRVLYFYANWCPTCIPADKNFKANADKIPDDVQLIRVNYNDTDTDKEEKGLAAKYGVTYQHTFVQVDANGKEVTKWNGGQIEELLANVQ